LDSQTARQVPPSGPPAPAVGLEWLLDVVHEIAHAHAGTGAACLFVSSDESHLQDVCPSMGRETSGLLVEALQDAGVEVGEILEPVRLYLPVVEGHEHVLVLPLSWRGASSGVMVVAAPAPPLGRAGLNRVMYLASNGLGWVSAAEERSEVLAATTSDRERLSAELAEARLFLELQETLVAAPTTGAVVAHLATWLDAPVAVQMPNLIVAEAAGPDARDIALSDQRSDLERGILTRSTTDRLPLIPAASRLPARVVAPILGNTGEFAGFLVAGVGHRGAELTRRALALSRGLIAYQLSIRQDLEQSAATLRRNLLTDLLADRFTDDLATQAAKLGHDLSAVHLCIAVGTATGAPLSAIADRVVNLVERCSAQASAASVSALVGISEDMVIAFVPEPVPAGGAALARAVFAEAVAEGMDVLVGVGPHCAQPAELPGIAARARWAVQVLRTADGRGTRVAHFEDLGVYGLLFDHHRAADLTTFAHRWLGPLLEYDRKHRSDLVETLRQLFRRRSLADAAGELHIHISTLKYRVGRIEEILGISVETWDNVFHLELALRILAVNAHLAAPARAEAGGDQADGTSDQPVSPRTRGRSSPATGGVRRPAQP
jgi:sugar diacid utilization regulator